jgi:PRC-barrel domain
MPATLFQLDSAGHLRCMFPAENLRDWRGEKIIDPDGDKIGDLEAVYVDTATDHPTFATVRIGLIGRHKLAFVPLDGATVLPRAVRVRYDKKLIGEAPTIDVDGELAAADEPRVFAHYNLPYQTGATGERRLARR